MPREFTPEEQAEARRKADEWIEEQQGIQSRVNGTEPDGGQPDAHDDPTGKKLTLTPASEIEMRIPKWLWDWRIPIKAITLLAGREGIGKSTYVIHLTAQITRGTLPGRYHGKPHSVAIIATEDTWAEVIVPRLVAAGADLDRVYRVDVTDQDNNYETLSLPADLRRLEQLCRDNDVVLVVCDPLMSLIHGSIDTHIDQQTRKVLTPLRDFADRAHLAVLAVIHLNKTSTTDPLNAVMASKAFTAAARSILFAAADPENEDQYLLGHPKSNIGPEQPTLGYRIEAHRIQLDAPDEDGGDLLITSKILPGDTDTRSIQEVMMQAAEQKQKPNQGEPANDLLDWLGGQPAAVSLKDIADRFPEVKRTTLRSALSRLVGRGLLTKPTIGLFKTTEPQSPPVTDAPVTRPSLPGVLQPGSVPSSVQQLQQLQPELHMLQGLQGGRYGDTATTPGPPSLPVTDAGDKTCQVCNQPLSEVHLRNGDKTHAAHCQTCRQPLLHQRSIQAGQCEKCRLIEHEKEQPK
jgi:hypothetical protein